MTEIWLIGGAAFVLFVISYVAWRCFFALLGDIKGVDDDMLLKRDAKGRYLPRAKRRG